MQNWSQSALNDSHSGILADLQGRRNLLVTFGGVRQGLGTPVFEFYNSIADLDCDKLYIRDFHQAWYQKGVDDQIDSQEKLLDFLSQTLQQHPYQRSCFIGNSMGGYAALLFGCLLNVDSALAFAPQSFIGPWHRRWYRDRRWPEPIRNVHQHGRTPQWDLARFLRKQPYRTRLHAYYSSLDRLDRRHALRLRKLHHMQLHPLPIEGHRVVRTLRDDGRLYTILASLLRTDQS